MKNGEKMRSGEHKLDTKTLFKSKTVSCGTSQRTRDLGATRTDRQHVFPSFTAHSRLHFDEFVFIFNRTAVIEEEIAHFHKRSFRIMNHNSTQRASAF